MSLPHPKSPTIDSMNAPALPFLPFALPEIGDEEIAEVVDTLKSGWVTTGPKAKRFEAAFTEFLGEASLESIAVNSATAGLHLALEALGIGPGTVRTHVESILKKLGCTTRAAAILKAATLGLI